MADAAGRKTYIFLEELANASNSTIIQTGDPNAGENDVNVGKVEVNFNGQNHYLTPATQDNLPTTSGLDLTSISNTVDFLTVTQNVNLDTMESDIATNNDITEHITITQDRDLDNIKPSVTEKLITGTSWTIPSHLKAGDIIKVHLCTGGESGAGHGTSNSGSFVGGRSGREARGYVTLTAAQIAAGTITIAISQGGVGTTSTSRQDPTGDTIFGPISVNFGTGVANTDTDNASIIDIGRLSYDTGSFSSSFVYGGDGAGREAGTGAQVQSGVLTGEVGGNATDGFGGGGGGAAVLGLTTDNVHSGGDGGNGFIILEYVGA